MCWLKKVPNEMRLRVALAIPALLVIYAVARDMLGI